MAIIDGVKSNINENSKFRVGYIGYRDFGDEGDFEHFDKLEYTEDLEKAKEKIKASRASGGGDQAEDVIGGLE